MEATIKQTETVMLARRDFAGSEIWQGILDVYRAKTGDRDGWPDLIEVFVTGDSA